MYQYIETINRGAYGIVLKVHDAEGRIKALKCNLKDCDVDGIANIRETAILYHYKHPHIVDVDAYHVGRIEEILDEKGCDAVYSLIDNEREYKNLTLDSVFMVMECADGDGDLTVVNENSSATDDDMKVMLLHTLLALEFLHSCGIAHLDIKANNVLNFGNKSYKICDTGMCMHVNRYNTAPSKLCIEAFRAPELLIKIIAEECNDKVHYNIDPRALDIWCVGMMWTDYLYGQREGIFSMNRFEMMQSESDLERLYNMLLLEHTDDDIEELNKISRLPMKYYNEYFVDKKRDYTVNQSYDDFHYLLKKMLYINPKKRWTATQCLDSDYFSKYRSYIESVRKQCPAIPNIQTLYKSKYNILFDSIDNETFTADRLFNEYMYSQYDSKIEKPEDKEKYAYDDDELYLIRYTCWYIMHKYYGVMQESYRFPVDNLRAELTGKYKNKSDRELLQLVAASEEQIIRHFEGRVYRTNPLDYLKKPYSADERAYLVYYIAKTTPGIYDISQYMSKFNSMSEQEKAQLIE